MNRLTGTVLWWEARDGQGIITDEAQNEHYVDSSVIDHPAILESGVKVTFESRVLGACLCAHKVCVDRQSALDRAKARLAALARVSAPGAPARGGYRRSRG